jgi:AraC-like DNA-binding protein
MSDPRATRAREAHRLAGDASRVANQHREQRDQLIRALRNENPEHWTYTALAAAVGCSPELVAAIIKGRTRYRPIPPGRDKVNPRLS